MIGRTILHYRVTKKIGTGGMGEVYLAQDTHLNRPVALKFLPEVMEGDPVAAKRFLREAQSAARLDHPFICKVYESQKVEGRTFIAMEYVDGPTLKKHMADQGPLAIAAALRIALEISEALETAQNQDTVHRDLKPSNIMLTADGHVKVMDFGLAKRLERGQGGELKEGTTLTGHGLIAGTLFYMSPEQVKGEDADTRSDIFTFGVLLYEMLTGINPFRKPSPIETAASILSFTPAPLSEYRDDIPPGLEAAVARMLQKEREERYQDVATVKDDLSHVLDESSGLLAPPFRPTFKRSAGRIWAWGGLATAALAALFWGWSHLSAPTAFDHPQIRSVAVLPFVTHSDQSNQEYFTDGLTDNLITNLAQISALKVISLSSVLAYREAPKAPHLVAKELGVDALVEASVTQIEDRLAINVRLIDGRDGGILWSQPYDEAFQDVLNLQRRVAGAIADELDIELTVQEQARLQRSESLDHNLIRAYLRGNYHLNRRSEADLDRARGYYEEAIRRNPEFAPAYAGRADALLLLGYYGFRSADSTFGSAKAGAEAAIRLDGQLAEAHASLGLIRFLREWDWPGAEQEFSEAIQLNPSYARAHQWYGLLLSATMRHEEALKEVRKARELDPLSPFVAAMEGVSLHLARRFSEAVPAYRRALQIDSSYPLTHLYLALSYGELGEHQKAQDHLGIMERSGRTQAFLFGLGNHLSRQGKRQETLDVIEELDSQAAVPGAHDVEKAGMLARLGDHDDALRLLESAFGSRSIYLVYIGVDTSLDPLRDNPRFQILLRGMGLSQPQQGAALAR